MNALDSLRKFFRSPQQPTIALPDSPFVVLDRDHLIEELRLEEKALEAGENDLPSSDAEGWDVTEAAVVAEMGEHLHRAQINATANHNLYGQRLSELALLRELSSVSSSSHTALGDYSAAVRGWQNRLANAEDEVRQSYSSLETFKKTHGLSRPAHDQLTGRLAWSAILGALFFEAVLNTIFLRVNDAMGLLGGFLAALVVAGMNIAAAWLAGRYAFPWAHHRKPIPKSLGLLGAFLWIVFLIGWNLLAAHFRDAKASGVPDPEAFALGHAWNFPLELANIISIAMLLFGIIFGIVACIASYKMDDPYPGYGETYRRHEERCDDYADEVDDAMDELRKIRDDGIGTTQEVKDQLRSQFSERGQIITARDAHRARFAEHQDYLEAVGNYLLEFYRETNRKERSTPPPPHFNERWRVTRSTLPPVPDEPSIENEVTAAQAALTRSIETISEAYVKAIESFKSLEEIKRELRDG